VKSCFAYFSIFLIDEKLLKAFEIPTLL